MTEAPNAPACSKPLRVIVIGLPRYRQTCYVCLLRQTGGKSADCRAQ
jgi:hypothetical protein